LQNIVDNPVAGYFLINEEGKIAEMNGKMMELYEAADREELMGKTCHILNADCDKEPLSCNCEDESCCNSGKILKRIMKDGTIRHHLLWARKTPEYENGKVFEGLVFDVSDQIHAEEETKRNLGKYNQLFQIIDQGIAILEAVFDDESRKIVDFKFIEVNRGYEKLTGFKNYNIRGKTILEVMPEMDGDWVQAYSEVVLKKKHKHFERESKYLNKRFDVYAYFYEENKIGLMVSDITAKSQILEQLKSAIIKAEELNEGKNKFLRNITHELRTPMNSIMGLLQLFEMTDLDDEQIEDVELMKDASEKMLSLINKIIHLIESEQSSSSEVACFDLKQLTETLIRETKPAVSEDVILDCQIDSDIPDQLWGDHISLMKILEELLANAVKFTDRGRISLSAKNIQSYRGKPGTVMIELSVTDTGIGIEEERLPVLFQEFTQIDASVIKRYEGAGIGLALCKNLAEKMDAVINVHSEVRKGSVFTVYVILSTDANNR
jgi:PAS domain S-box-containing protein